MSLVLNTHSEQPPPFLPWGGGGGLSLQQKFQKGGLDTGSQVLEGVDFVRGGEGQVAVFT